MTWFLYHQPTYFHLSPTLLGPPRKPSSHNVILCWRRIFCKSCCSQCFVPSLPQEEHLVVSPPRSTHRSSFCRWVVSLPAFHSFNSLSFRIIHICLLKSSVLPDKSFASGIPLCVKYLKHRWYIYLRPLYKNIRLPGPIPLKRHNQELLIKKRCSEVHSWPFIGYTWEQNQQQSFVTSAWYLCSLR